MAERFFLVVFGVLALSIILIKVIGFGRGAFSDYMASNAAMTRPLPEGWSESKGAALWTSWYTAAGALKQLGRVQEGEWVLIHAAAGGVGQAATTLAKHFGAKVIATASSPANLAMAFLYVSRFATHSNFPSGKYILSEL